MSYVLEWSGSLLGILGAVIMALSANDVRRQLQAYWAFLASSTLLLAYGCVVHAWGVSLMSGVFCIINAGGLYARWPRQRMRWRDAA